MLTNAEPLIDVRFRAMGTDVHVAVVGAAANLLELAEQRIRELERRWSRFLDDSEISTLNHNPGRPVVVSADTFELVTRAVEAWRATGG